VKKKKRGNLTNLLSAKVKGIVQGVNWKPGNAEKEKKNRVQELLPAVDLFVGDGELFTAFPAACCQYPLAVGGGHALPEAVLVGSFPAGGLIGPFHGYGA